MHLLETSSLSSTLSLLLGSPLCLIEFGLVLFLRILRWLAGVWPLILLGLSSFRLWLLSL